MSVLITLAALALVASPTPAQIEPPDRTVHTLRVTYVEPYPRNTMYVELNDGSTWRLNPCKVEDGRRCYWDSDVRGNKIGRSFVSLRGEIIYTHKI